MRYVQEYEHPEHGHSQYFYWPSVHDLINQEVPEQSERTFQGSTYGRGNDSSWFGVENAEAVDKALTKGWPEGTAQMREAFGKVELPKLPSVRRKRRRADHGDFVDIHRVYKGDLSRAWDKMKREQSLATSGNHITVVCDVCCSSTVRAHSAMWRGAAAVALAEAAMLSGRSVRIILTWGAVNAWQQPDEGHALVERLDCAVEIKPYNANVSIDVLMTLLSLPGMFRVHGFRGLASVDHNRIRASFGKPIDFNRKLLADGSQMIWIGRHNLSQDVAQQTVNDAAKAMVRRVGHDEYRKTG